MPRPYEGEAALLSCQRGATGSQWRQLIAGNLEIHEVQGQHLDAIKGASVEVWGKLLRSCILKSLQDDLVSSAKSDVESGRLRV